MSGRLLSRAARAAALLAHGHRLQPDVLRPALPRHPGHAAARLHLPGPAGLGRAQPGVDGRRVRHGRSRRSCFVVNIALQPAARRARGRQPVGRVDARVGDHVAAAARQLRARCRRCAAAGRSGTSRTPARAPRRKAAADGGARPRQERRRGLVLHRVRDGVLRRSSSSRTSSSTSTRAGGPTAASVLDVKTTGIFTACLLASSVTLCARRAAPRRDGADRRVRVLARRHDRPRRASSSSARATSTSGSSSAASTSTRNLFATTFFTLTGFHGLHVTVGLVALASSLALALAGDFQSAAVHAAARGRALLALRRRRLARRLHRRLPEGRADDDRGAPPVLPGARPARRSRSASRRSPRTSRSRGRRARRARAVLFALALRALAWRSRRRSARSPTATSSARTCCSTCCSCSSCRRWRCSALRRRCELGDAAADRATCSVRGRLGRSASARCGSGTRRRSATRPRTSPLVHRVQEVSLLVDGARLLVADPRAARGRRLPRSRAIVYLFTACVGVHAPRHPHHVLARRGVLGRSRTRSIALGVMPLVRDGWGLTPERDQQLGGLLMWVPGVPRLRRRRSSAIAGALLSASDERDVTTGGARRERDRRERRYDPAGASPGPSTSRGRPRGPRRWRSASRSSRGASSRRRSSSASASRCSCVSLVGWIGEMRHERRESLSRRARRPAARPRPRRRSWSTRRRFLARVSVGLGALRGRRARRARWSASSSRRSSARYRTSGAPSARSSDFKVGETVNVTFVDASPLPWAGVTANTAAWLRRDERDRVHRLLRQLRAPRLPGALAAGRAASSCARATAASTTRTARVAAGPPPHPLSQYPSRVNGRRRRDPHRAHPDRLTR